jgi:acyl-CoA synthetase (NDP forming)
MSRINSTMATASERSQRMHQCLFSPQSIAVIGASTDSLKPGGRVFNLIHQHGYEGKLWPVNPKATELLGVPVISSIAALPSNPDLALVAIPSHMVLTAVTELAEMGTGAVIVLTSGFGEKDAAGKEIEERMKQVADGAGMALIGPNCSGFLTTSYKGKFAGIVPQLPGGDVDFISGSGATVDYVMECAEARGLSFGTVINLGNSAQMGVEDLLKIYDENYNEDCAKILMIYMEAVKKPALLLKHSRSLGKKGCIMVGIKSGATEAGSRAAASHTGAMATSDTAVEALFQKAGIIRVTGRAALIDVCCVIKAVKGRLLGKRVCIVTDAGGPGVMLADELNRGQMQLPALSEKTLKELAKILPAESSIINPIDALPSRTDKQIEAIIRILGELELDNLDAIAFLTGDSGLSDNTAIYQAISDASSTSPIPILPMLSSLTSCDKKIDTFIRQGNVFFPDEVEMATAVSKVASYVEPVDVTELPSGYDQAGIKQALAGPTGALDPTVVKQVLISAGFILPEQLEVFDKSQLDQECQRIGFPLVMKVIGPLHKTDVGGVRLGITNGEDALQTWSELMAIDEATGVLLQPMVTGQEVILGASLEGDFGHLVMFGLGGIYAEVLKDVQFALAPLAPSEARRMIDEIRCRPLLDGVRGEPGMNVEILGDFLIRLGRLVADFPEIAEIDLNPVKGTGDRLYVVDSRIIMKDNNDA